MNRNNSVSPLENIQTEPHFDRYMPNSIIETFHFSSIGMIDLQIAMDEIRPKGSQGFDGISTKLLKRIFPYIKASLLFLIIQSLTTGISPDKLMLAKIIPIYKKKGDIDDFQNYRPISLLSSFSKIFEKVVYKQIFEYFDENELFCESQFGLWENQNIYFVQIANLNI